MSIRLCATVTLGEGSPDSLKSEVAEALHGAAEHVDEIQRSHAGVYLPGSVGSGDLTLDFLVPDASALGSLERTAASQETSRLLGALGEPRPGAPNPLIRKGSPWSRRADPSR